MLYAKMTYPTALFNRIEEELKLWATRSTKNTEEIGQWAMKFRNSNYTFFFLISLYSSSFGLELSGHSNTL